MSIASSNAAKLAVAIPNLLRALDDEMGADFSQPARVLMFEADDAGVTFGIKELAAGQHPLEELLGFVAPDEWCALGTVCHGWASAELTARPSQAADRFRIRSVHVVSRDGSEIGGFRRDGASLALQETVIGMVPDALRRCLGLSTPAADFPAAELNAADWLDAIADDPAAILTPPRPYADWDQARWEVITRAREVPNLSPTLATWMDAGIFARWIAATYPRTTDHLAAIRRVVDTDTYDAVRETLVGWGLTD
jgi:hypothetical protein